LGLNELSERWLTEQWLLTAGVVPDSSADTLLMYAYAQKGVQKATLKIDRDEDNMGKSPSITYQIELDAWAHVKWRIMGWAKKRKNPILRKLILLFLAKMNAPIFLTEGIAGLAKDYLPGQYSIRVEIKDE
jgi:hypothetical protein